MAAKKPAKDKLTVAYKKTDEDVKVEAVQVTEKNAGDIADQIPSGYVVPDGGPDQTPATIRFDNGWSGMTEAHVGQWLVVRDKRTFVVNADEFEAKYSKA